MKSERFLSQKGFSLIEIAIVLVVVGLLVSGGLLGLAPVIDTSKTAETNAKLDKIEQALILYAIRNGTTACLPCPSQIAAAVTGLARDDGTGDYATGCTSDATDNACSPVYGVVPWVNLGLSRDDVIDAYGNYIDYRLSTGGSLNDSAGMLRSGPSTYPAGTLTAENLAGTDQTAAAAYVLISHGKDGSYAYRPGSAAVRPNPNAPAAAPNAQGCNQATPVQCTGIYTAGNFVLDKAQGKAGAGGYFDDIVRFKTAPIIVQNCGAGACGNPE